jgi:hypothetical protein
MSEDDTSGILIQVPEDSFRGGSATSKLERIDADELASNVQSLLSNLGSALERYPINFPKGKLKELVLNLGVSVDGKVSILGTGISAGATASLEVHIEFEG